jgi:hypothetical protein
MPSACIDATDAIELAETLQLIARWLAADPERLAASLLDFIAHPAYGPAQLRQDLDASPSSSAAPTARSYSGPGQQ